MLKCSDCKLQFKFPSNLKEHRIYKHETERNFECLNCKKFYKTTKDLKAHARNHSTENLFPCDLCEKSFKRRDMLRRHQLRHGNQITVELIKTTKIATEQQENLTVEQIKKSASDLKECVLDNWKMERQSQESEQKLIKEENDSIESTIETSKSTGNFQFTIDSPLSHLVFHRSRAIFTQQQEIALEYLLEKAKQMFCGVLSAQKARNYIYKFCWLFNSDKLPKKWKQQRMCSTVFLHKFMKRHPHIFIQDSAADFHDYYEKIVTVFKISPKQIWNFDEILLKIETAASQKVRGQKFDRFTFGGFISAAGSKIPPFYVLPRVKFNSAKMLKNGPENCAGAGSRTGLMNTAIFQLILIHLASQTASNPRENPVLLLLDRLRSHIALESLVLANYLGIILLTFPPKTTAQFQPLDQLEMFPKFRKLFEAEAENLKSQKGKKKKGGQRKVKIESVVGLTRNPFENTFTETAIEEAFEKTKLNRNNKTKFAS